MAAACLTRQVVSHDATHGFRIVYEDGDEEDLDLESMTRLPLLNAAQLVGRRVSKHFPGRGRFGGTVESHCKQFGYLVRYEDDDEEHLSSYELLAILAHAKAARKKRR